MLSGSLVAIVTPMRGDGGIDFEAWDRLLDLHAGAGSSGIVVGGSTGESVSLATSELHELLSRARVRLGARMPLIAGVGGSNTAAVCAQAHQFSPAQVEALLVVTPAYNRPTQEGLYRHFAAIAAAASVPIVLYNVPARTAVDLLPATVARLCELPTVIGIKEAVGNLERIRELLRLVPKRCAVLSGDDASARESVLAGAQGVISVTANVVPAAMAAMIAAAARADRAAAERLDAPLALLHRELGAESNPIPVKWALGELGLIGPGLRLPLTPLSESLVPRLRAALRAAQAYEPATQVRSA